MQEIKTYQPFMDCNTQTADFTHRSLV